MHVLSCLLCCCVLYKKDAPGEVPKDKICCLLRQHVPNLLIAEDDVVHWFSPVLEGSVVVVDVRGEKDLGVPGEALAGGKVRDLEEVNELARGFRLTRRGSGSETH